MLFSTFLARVLGAKLAIASRRAVDLSGMEQCLKMVDIFWGGIKKEHRTLTPKWLFSFGWMMVPTNGEAVDSG